MNKQPTNKFVKQLNTSLGDVKGKVNFSKAETIQRDNEQLDKRVVDMVFNHIPPMNKNPVYGITYLGNGSGIIASLLNVENHKADADINKIVFSQWVYGTQHSLAKMLFSKAEIKWFTDKEM